MFGCTTIADSVYTTFAYVYTSTESEYKSLTENWSSNFIFTELMKKATTTETVTERENMTKRKLEHF